MSGSRRLRRFAPTDLRSWARILAGVALLAAGVILLLDPDLE
jgi:hypothetical protein